MRADHRPQRQKQRHQGDPAILPGQIEVAVEDQVGETLLPAMVEVHQEESEVVEDIDAGEVFGKLDAIEQHRPSVDQTDIAQMQVAVTAPHLSRRPPLVDEPPVLRQFAAHPLLDAVDLRGGEAGRAAGAQAADIGLHQLRQRGGSAPVEARLRLLVKRGDVGAQRVEERRRQRAGPGHFLQEVRLIEAPHHHHEIHGLAAQIAAAIALRAAPHQAAVGEAADRPDFEIELRRGAAVERQLGGAGGTPARHGGKIEIGIFDGALQLVGAISREKHDRGMRLDNFHRSRAGRIGSGIAQKRDDIVLCIIHRQPAAATLLIRSSRRAPQFRPYRSGGR